MTGFVEVPLPDGGSLIVERVNDEDIVRAGRIRDVTGMAAETFESALGRLRSAAEMVRSSLQETALPPSEVTVEFAVKLGTAMGVVVANTTAEANLRVAMRWDLGTEAQRQ